MENKYYTPTIEEFHVGFEYEYLNRDKWISTVMEEFDEGMTPGTIFCNEDGTLGEEASKVIRVKCLDKEDIESLGFICEEENEDGSFYKYSKDSYNNSKIILNHYIWITGIDNDFTEHNKIKIYRTGGEPLMLRRNSIVEKIPIDRDMLSLSTIKNKSELKILLKQLGIE